MPDSLDNARTPSLDELKRTTRDLLATLQTVLDQSWRIAQQGAEISREMREMADRAARSPE